MNLFVFSETESGASEYPEGWMLCDTVQPPNSSFLQQITDRTSYGEKASLGSWFRGFNQWSLCPFPFGITSWQQCVAGPVTFWQETWKRKQEGLHHSFKPAPPGARGPSPGPHPLVSPTFQHYARDPAFDTHVRGHWSKPSQVPHADWGLQLRHSMVHCYCCWPQITTQGKSSLYTYFWNPQYCMTDGVHCSAQRWHQPG